MKVMSFNCQGLASPFKKSSLKCSILRAKLKVIFLQETMGTREVIKGVLHSLLPGLDFMVLDAKDRSGGVATGWRVASCHLINSWGSKSCLGTDVFFQDLNLEFHLLNVYGPYLNKEAFWDCLF